jgi:hypothetical protein
MGLVSLPTDVRNVVPNTIQVEKASGCRLGPSLRLFLEFLDLGRWSGVVLRSAFRSGKTRSRRGTEQCPFHMSKTPEVMICHCRKPRRLQRPHPDLRNNFIAKMCFLCHLNYSLVFLKSLQPSYFTFQSHISIHMYILQTFCDELKT